MARLSKHDRLMWEAHRRLAEVIADVRELSRGEMDDALTENIILGHMAPVEKAGHYTLTDAGREHVEQMQAAQR